MNELKTNYMVELVASQQITHRNVFIKNLFITSALNVLEHNVVSGNAFMYCS